MILRLLRQFLFGHGVAYAGAEQLLERHAREESRVLQYCGQQLLARGDRAQAARLFGEAVLADAGNAAALSSLAAIRMEDDPEAAIRDFRKAARCTPYDNAIHINLGTALLNAGRLDEARHSYLHALTLDPASAAARYNLATLNLAEGRYGADTWDDFRARRRDPSYNGDFLLAGVRYLGGAELPRERLLVHLEQGLGDEIWQAGCFDELRAHAAAIALVCEPRLQSLFAASFPGIAVIARAPGWQEHARAFAPQAQLYAGDLAYWLRRGNAAFPGPRAYLRPDTERRAHWRARLRALGAGSLKIGISWRGGTATTGRNARSVPLWDWAALFSLPGIDWVDLQYGEHRAELAAAQSAGVPITRFEDALADYHETAALVAELDLVISVTTAVVDLAGALDRPCWVFVPRRPQWKFGIAGERTPWYPSLRLQRQGPEDAPGEWGSVMKQAARQLQGRAQIAAQMCPPSRAPNSPFGPRPPARRQDAVPAHDA